MDTDWFHLSAIVKNAALDIHVHIFVDLFLPDANPPSWWEEEMPFVSWGVSQLWELDVQGGALVHTYLRIEAENIGGQVFRIHSFRQLQGKQEGQGLPL